jgi:hypothetical protein
MLKTLNKKMFNVFVKKIKTGVLNIRNKLIFFIKLVNLNLVFNLIYFIIIYDSIVHVKNHNSFLSSLLNNLLTYCNISELSTITFIFFIVSLKNILYSHFYNIVNSKTTKEVSYFVNDSFFSFKYNSIYLYLLYISYSFSSVLINLNYLYF